QFVQADILFPQEYHQVEKQVGRLVQQVFVGLGQGSDHRFGGFLPDFLRDLGQALSTQFINIGSFHRVFIPVADNLFELKKKGSFVVVVKAGGGSPVTGGAGRFGQDQQSVLIAVWIHVDYLQEISAFLPLGPEPVPASGKKRNPVLRNGLYERFAVHIAQH